MFFSFEKSILSRSEGFKVVRFEEGNQQIINSFEGIEKTIKYLSESRAVKLNCINTGIINFSENKLVVVNGLKDAVVVTTDDVVYVEGNGQKDDIKNFFVKQKPQFSEYITDNVIKYRPWGYYVVKSKKRAM